MTTLSKNSKRQLNTFSNTISTTIRIVGIVCAKNWETQEKIMKELKYHHKNKDAHLYSQIRAIHEKFCTHAWLMDLWYDVHLNKFESLNGFITKFLLKNKFFATAWR
jgi:hypothetical protein